MLLLPLSYKHTAVERRQRTESSWQYMWCDDELDLSPTALPYIHPLLLPRCCREGHKIMVDDDDDNDYERAAVSRVQMNK